VSWLIVMIHMMVEMYRSVLYMIVSGICAIVLLATQSFIIECCVFSIMALSLCVYLYTEYCSRD
jgi:hypothetical protein